MYVHLSLLYYEDRLHIFAPDMEYENKAVRKRELRALYSWETHARQSGICKRREYCHHKWVIVGGYWMFHNAKRYAEVQNAGYIPDSQLIN
jgi:hypothetical protein